MDPGYVIGERYALEAALGEGGMAEVWRAHDQRLGRDVAIKLLSPRLADDPEFLVRFFAEAQVLARLAHPNIVSVSDFGQTHDRPYLVMEYVSGGAVSELVGRAVAVEHAVDITAQAARGAGAAHDSGLVHRDIKPGNVLVTDDGTVKLADFGIASSSDAERLTGTGAAVGSPHYVSPEHALGTGTGPASDVYSLGVVLYELLTGQRPFEGDNPTAVAIAHVEQPPAPPSSLRPDLDPRLDALVMRCLAKEPAERYADGSELADALRSLDASDALPVGMHEARPPRLLVAGLIALLLGAATAGPLLSARKGGPRVEPGRGAHEQTHQSTKRKPVGTPSSSPSVEIVAGTSTPSPSPGKTERQRTRREKKRTLSKRSEATPKATPTATETPSPSPSPSPSPTGSSPEPSPTPTPSDGEVRSRGPGS